MSLKGELVIEGPRAKGRSLLWASLLLHMGASSLDWLAMYLAMTPFEFEVREPPELIGHIRALAQRLQRGTG